MNKITCEKCNNLIYEYPFYFCKFERTENSDADVTSHWKPFNFQPNWCKIKKEEGIK